METLTLPIEKEKTIRIYNPKINYKSSADVKILRIEFNDEYTIIDFLYSSSTKYENGGWVQISKYTFIRVVGTKKKLRLIKAENIPIAPKKHFFKVPKEMLAYTLYFPALPKGCEKIDIIESESGAKNLFNFYGVSMYKISKKIRFCIN
ncbi:MAG: hypothetical protein AB7O47_09135 [Flavobacteriales bacterium]